MKKDLEKFIILLRKGVICYTYIDSWEKYNETSLPANEKFFSLLKNRRIMDGDFKHAQRVYRTSNMKSLGFYSHDYVLLNAAQLIDCKVNFKLCMHKRFKFDPLFFVTLISLSWEASIKTTRKELELLTDFKMILFCEKSNRGRATRATCHYAEENNKYILWL